MEFYLALRATSRSVDASGVGELIRRAASTSQGRRVVFALLLLFVAVSPSRAQSVAVASDELATGLARQFRQALLAERKLADDRELGVVRTYEFRIRQYQDSLARVQGGASRTLQTALTAVRAERDRYVDSLSRRLSETDVQRRALEREVRGLATTEDPQRRAALARFVDGDRVGAMPVLKELTRAQKVVRERVTSLQTAAAYRQDGVLLQTMHRLGEMHAAAVLAQYDTVAMYDPEDVETQLVRVRYARAVRNLSVAQEAATAALRLATLARDSARALDALGGISFFRDDLSVARAQFEASLDIRERLAANAAAEPAVRYAAQNDLAVSLSQLGQLFIVIGDLDKARAKFEASLAIDQRLLIADPGSLVLQDGLATSLEQLGDLAAFREDLPEARIRYEESLAIRERLAAADPSDRRRQRSLGFALYKVGNAARRGRDFDEARVRLAACHAIRERLATSDSTDAEAQRNLLFSSNGLGSLSLEVRDFAEARTRFVTSVAIARRLAAGDPTSAIAQRDLGITLIGLSDAAIGTFDFAAARSFLSESHAIFERRATDNANVAAQRDLYMSLLSLGELAVKTGDLAEARARFASGHSISKRLADGDSSTTAFQRMLSESSYLLSRAEYLHATTNPPLAEAESRALLQAALSRTLSLRQSDPENDKIAALLRDIEARLRP